MGDSGSGGKRCSWCVCDGYDSGVDDGGGGSSGGCGNDGDSDSGGCRCRGLVVVAVLPYGKGSNMTD